METRSGIRRAEELDSLGELADPTRFVEPLDVTGRDRSRLEATLARMVLIRQSESRIGDLVAEGEVRCPCHLAIGQEATAVGVSGSLQERDRVFGGHRSHAHYLALGGDLDALLAEVLGKVEGCSRGMGGSMHLHAPEHGFVGSVPIVAATIPIAVGAALALRRAGEGGAAVSWFGDGASEEGVFHESLNLASSRRLPVLFACENNLYASHLDIRLRQPSDAVSRFARAHRIRALVVDGNDVLAVEEAAAELIGGLRCGEGPAFLEAVTYRHRGHVGPREDIDVGVRRSREDLEAWKARDPIERLAAGMRRAGWLEPGREEEIRAEARSRVEEAIVRARRAPYPGAEALHDALFAGGAARRRKERSHRDG